MWQDVLQKKKKKKKKHSGRQTTHLHRDGGRQRFADSALNTGALGAKSKAPKAGGAYPKGGMWPWSREMCW